MLSKIAIGAAVAASVAVSGCAVRHRVPQYPVHTQPAQQRDMPSRSFNNISEVAVVSGRAMRTMARLAMKIEQAEQRGDEVSIPGWTEEDDAALISAIVDFVGAVTFCRNLYHSYYGIEDPLAREDLLPLLHSEDKDIRIGAALVGAYVTHIFDDRPPDEFLAALRAAVSHADPEIRAAGVFSLIPVLIHILGHREELEMILGAAIQDEAKEVRFAAAQPKVMGAYPRIPPEFEKLLDDESAGVRLAMRRTKFFRLRWPSDGGEAWRMVEMMFSDPNPIARSAAVPLISRYLRTDEERARLAELVANIDDEWLKLNPMVALMQTPGNNNLDAISDLAASPKRSHRVLAASSLFAMMTINREIIQGEGHEPQLPAVTRLPEPVDIWSRAAFLFLNSFGDQDEAERLWIEALQSDDEPARLSSLLAISARGEVEASTALIDGIESSFRRGVYAEKAAAVQAMSSLMTPDQLMAALEKAVDDGASRAELALFLNGFRRQIASHRDPVKRAEYSRKIIDIFIKADDPDLTAMLAMNLFWSSHSTDKQNQLSFVYLIEEAQPEAVLLILNDPRIRFHMTNRIFRTLSDEKKLNIITGRLEEMAGSLDANIREGAADAVKNNLMWGLSGRWLSNQDRQAIEDLLVRTARQLMGFGEDGINEALGMLAIFLVPHRYPRPFIDWKDAGPELRALMVDALKRADEPAHSAQAAEVLSGLYWGNRNHTGWDIAEYDPDLLTAMDRARQAIMEHGEPAEQIAVMCGILMGHSQDDLMKQTTAVLEERFMAGEVPAEIEIRAWDALIRRRQMLSPEFCRWALNQWNEKTFEIEAHGRIISVISGAANYHRVRAEWRRAPLPLPQWITEAEIMTSDILVDKERMKSDRIQAMRMYVYAAGKRAAELIEAIILDETDSIRIHAVGYLNFVSPRSEIYARLLPVYDDLPLELRLELVQSTLKSPEAPESEEFFIAAMRDPDIENRIKTRWISRGEKPETPALRDFVNEIKNDPQLGEEVDMILTRWAHEEEKRQRY